VLAERIMAACADDPEPPQQDPEPLPLFASTVVPS
jgi:hypothetical protein